MDLGKKKAMTSMPDKKESWKITHAKMVKEQNEHCFLPNKQAIRYHTTLLLELFNIDDFDKLAEGLDSLYSELDPFEKNRLTYRKVFTDPGLFSRGSYNLPFVVNIKNKGKWFMPSQVYHKLDSRIDWIGITLKKILPSTVILQIHIRIDENISTKINKIIYEYYNERKIHHNDRSYTILTPERIKRMKILKVKNDIKTKAIEFLHRYFSGHFFKNYSSDLSFVPSIDLFSFTYPANRDEITKWMNENRLFGFMMGTYFAPHLSFISGSYLLCVESEDKQNDNYLILANRIQAPINDKEFDSGLEYRITTYDFDLFALYDWLKSQDTIVSEFRASILEEFSLLQKSNLENAIKLRKNNLKNIIQFERLVAEYRNYDAFGDHLDFKSLDQSQSNPFDNLRHSIEKRCNVISELLEKYDKQSRMLLDLKSLEYNKTMQELVVFLAAMALAGGLYPVAQDYLNHCSGTIDAFFYSLVLAIVIVALFVFKERIGGSLPFFKKD
jgi:hypothetical protein